MKNKALIGILPSLNNEQTISLQKPYIKAIYLAGGMPIVIPFTEDEKILDSYIDMCDGILFSGGIDVSPELYREKRSEKCEEGCLIRDEFELLVFEKSLYKFKPIMAICRGMQLINVALGGTLYQDIPSEYITDMKHSQGDSKFVHSHEVNVLETTPLYTLLEQNRIRINSFHHQCIKELGRLLEVMATADDGIIEAVYMPSYRYLRAYQWHPERLCEIDKNQIKIFEDFVSECQKNGEENEYI